MACRHRRQCRQVDGACDGKPNKETDGGGEPNKGSQLSSCGDVVLLFCLLLPAIPVILVAPVIFRCIISYKLYLIKVLYNAYTLYAYVIISISQLPL